MESQPRLWSLIPVVLLLVALQFLVYGAALDSQFLKYDDDVYVYENANIQKLDAESIAWMFARPYYRSYTPLTLLSHAVDVQLWGNDPWGHHLSNLVLHSINAVLVFLFGLMIFPVARLATGGETPDTTRVSLASPEIADVIGAFFAAAIFSLHPVRVESIAWVSDRKDLLLAFFTLLCCMAYMRYETCRGTRRAVRWYLASLLLFVLAGLSKSIALVIPVVLILFDALLLRTRARGITWTTLVMEKVPFFIVSIAFGMLAIAAARGSQTSYIVTDFSPAQVTLNPFYSIMFYPAKLLWPAHLTPVYGPPGTPLMIIAAVAFVVVSGIAIAYLRKGNPWFLLAWLCYIVTTLPTIGGLSAGIQPWADRYSYLPAVSLFLLLGAGIRWLWDRFQRRSMLARGSVAVLCALPLVICGGLSMRQIPVWQNGGSLWTHAIAESPDLPMPYANLGVALEDNGDHNGALDMYAKAVGLEPHYADALYNMGVAYEAKGLPDSAVAFYTRAIAADTAYDDAYVNLGNLHVRAGRLDEGIRMYEQAIAIDGTKPDPYYNMGIALYTKRDREKALACFQSAIKRSAGYADAYHNMGVVYLDLGNGAAAIESFTRAARLGLPEAQRLLRSKGYSW